MFVEARPEHIDIFPWDAQEIPQQAQHFYLYAPTSPPKGVTSSF